MIIKLFKPEGKFDESLVTLIRSQVKEGIFIPDFDNTYICSNIKKCKECNIYNDCRCQIRWTSIDVYNKILPKKYFPEYHI